MDLSAAMMMKLAACLLFGTATVLLVFAARRLGGSSSYVPIGYTGMSMRRSEIRRRALDTSVWMRLALLLIGMIGGALGRLDLEVLRAYIREPYRRAGFPGGLDDDEVVALGVVIGIGLAAFVAFSAVVFFGPAWVLIGLIGMPLGFLVLVSSLKTRAALREADLMRGLPYALDLIVLILRSGASLTIAVRKVIEDYSNHPIGDELGQVLAEIEMGAPRSEAFKNFARRIQVTDITSLADSIVQSEELGWPLADSLEKLADRLSSERILRAQATAGSAGVLVMVPSTFVLAAAVLLLLGPIIVKYMIYGTLLG